MAKQRGKKKKSHWLSNLLMVLALAVFAVSAYQLFKIGMSYREGDQEYEEIKNLAIEESSKGAEGNGNEENSSFRVNFDKLLEINPDTVGWIRFDPEPEEINYPIVQGKDNQEYLHKTFSANENTLGAIFLKKENDKSFQDRNSVIYGHRMKNGSMFRHLSDYEDKSFWEENPYFYIYTPDGRKYVYHIYSAGEVVDMSSTYDTQFVSDSLFRDFLKMTKETAEYETGIEPGVNDRIVTLSTCTSASDEHRFVVRGVKVKEEYMQ